MQEHSLTSNISPYVMQAGIYQYFTDTKGRALVIDDINLSILNHIYLLELKSQQ